MAIVIINEVLVTGIDFKTVEVATNTGAIRCSHNAVMVLDSLHATLMKCSCVLPGTRLLTLYDLSNIFISFFSSKLVCIE